jgi:hypothetical protein
MRLSPSIEAALKAAGFTSIRRRDMGTAAIPPLRLSSNTIAFS